MIKLKEIARNITGQILNAFSGNNESYDKDKISIGITTFGNRFDQYFVPLLSRLKEDAPENEVIVAINGEHQQEFDECYRSQVLEFVARHKKAFPIMFPQFRGLSKLWNSIIINASND